MNFLLRVSPSRDTGYTTKQREIIFTCMGFEMLSFDDDNGNDDVDDSNEEGKADDDDWQNVIM